MTLKTSKQKEKYGTCAFRENMLETWKNKYMVPPALHGITLSGHTFLGRLEILAVIIPSYRVSLLFLYPTGELHICVAITEVWDTGFLLSISHLLIHLLPAHTPGDFPLYLKSNQMPCLQECGPTQVGI